MSRRRPAFPLRVAASRRHLEDADGVPFRVNTDAAWFAPTEFWMAHPADAAAWHEYLADRVAKGFTAVLMMGMVQHGYEGFQSFPIGAYRHLPDTRRTGEPPLLVPGDFSTPNPAYWGNVRDLIAAAGEHGVAVTLAYQYLGYQGGDQGWWRAIGGPANTVEVQHRFGAWLAELLAPQPNVIWYPYGDFDPPPGEGADRVRASIAGIRSVQPHALFAAELAPPDDVVGDHPDADELLDVNAFYGYGPGGDARVFVTALEAWRSTPTRPAWVCEPEYEGAGIGGTGAADAVRRAEYYGVLGGGTAGQVYGAIGVYNFVPAPGVDAAGRPVADWRTALQLPGARQQAHQFALWESLDWWALEPRGELVAAGQGDGLDHIALAATPDGRRIVAYLPADGARAFAVDASGMPGRVSAEWFDPTSGERTPIRRADPGVLEFTAPPRNARGAADWVLLLSAG